MNKLSRVDLVAALDELEAKLPTIIHEHEESRVMDAFDDEAKEILEQVPEADRSYFHDRIQCMLRDAGLIPGDEEPCATEAEIPTDLEQGTGGPV